MTAENTATPNLAAQLAGARARIAELEALVAFHSAPNSRPTAGPHPHPAGDRFRLQSVILDLTDDAVIAIDPDRIVTYMSPAAERLHGVRSSGALGKVLSSLRPDPPPDLKQEQPCWVLLSGGRSWQGEHSLVRKDGVQLTVSAMVNPLPDEIGGGMVAVLRDVTEERKFEQKNQRKVAELARANEDLRHYAYAVSHDLQAPLRSLMSFSQMLALKHGHHLDQQGNQLIGLITDAAHRMSVMICDLLALATCAENGRQVLAEISLETALTAALSNLRSEVHSTHAQITHDPLPDLLADPAQLTRLFQNLIGNSLIYRHADIPPHVHISADRGVDAWLFTFRDNGIGFEEQHAEQIFGVFKRLHADRYAGTGVGLAICKRIVEQRGGQIRAVGIPGRGAAFSFTIPDEPPEFEQA